MNALDIINFVICILFLMCYAFQFAYLLIPFVKKLPPHKETKLHKYAVLISARNEENVIGTLIDSIKAQDYPSELVTVVLVADNCTDDTARVGAEHGAVVYERHDMENIGKGYALDYVLKKLAVDYGEDAFDAFVVFDADNILTKNYLTEINKTFSDGYEVVTSYRNTKNFGESWIAGSCAVWYLREAKYLNGSRMRIGACPQVSGTGFLFSNKIKKENGGWPFHTLTEDYEFTCHSVAKGIKFGHCETAHFYDEQVPGFRQSWRQRLRWTKGGLQGFLLYWKQLIKGIFSKNFVASYDMFMSFAPAYVISMFAVVVNTVGAIWQIAVGYHVGAVIWGIAKMLLAAYSVLLLQSIVTVITEWKYIHAHPAKRILSMFTFPIFVMSFIPLCFVAIFKKVEWKPIAHTAVSGVEAEILQQTGTASADGKADATGNEN